MPVISKLAASPIRERLRHNSSYTTLDDGHDSTHHASEHVSEHIPFIASPLDPKTTEWLKTKHQASNLTLKRRPTVAQQEATRVSGGIFRKQKEASPLELFFDLFFVANLAVFSYNHAQVTWPTVSYYIGFVSIMWTFWFHVSIHDVRFYVDTILNRFLKLVQFAIWVAFTGLSPVYDTLEDGGMSRAYHGLALVFMVSRITFIIQYAVVFWYVRPFKKTMVPLGLMMLVYLCSAMAFLGTFIDGPQLSLTAEEGWHHVVIWYVIISIEAVLVIIISSIWRILSFKYTHLVERVGLLTLIIIGEGTIGIIKSLAKIVDGTTIDIWAAAGRVVSGVFLIYLCFVLYFSPIAHDRFGTIRQQFWVLCHHPLHVTILLATEGSAETLLWTTILSARARLVAALPSITNPSNGFATVNDLVNSLNNTMKYTASNYTYKKLKDIYDYNPDLLKIQNLSATYKYGSAQFNQNTTIVLNSMLNKTTNFFFENFKFEGPSKIKYMTDTDQKVAAYFGAYTVIFTTFYVGAGSLLFILGIMTWVGKTHKNWVDYVGIFLRLLIGAGLPFMCLLAYKQPSQTGFIFRQSGWIVAIVVFSYLLVIIIENIVQGIYDKRLDKKIARGQADASEKRHLSHAFGPHASHETVEHTPKHNMYHGDADNAKGIHFEEDTRPIDDPDYEYTSHGNRQHSESDGLISHEATLGGHHEGDHAPPPTSYQRTERSDEWRERTIHHSPPVETGSREHAFRTLDNGYSGHGYEHELDRFDTDVERGASGKH